MQNTDDNKMQRAMRYHKIQRIETFSEKEDYVECALKRIGPALDKICQDNHWHEDALKARLSVDYFPSAASYSRIKNNDGKRRASAAQLFELRRVSGISLDKLADGCDPFEFEAMTNARLVELVEQISRVLASRFRQETFPNVPRSNISDVL
ncbi:MAG: hypothetical protein MR837_03615 [Firmicutes bacterium]|nr:hypothetical protein [Bacillota bacterium]